ncbi:MAG: Gfo/Idh/MocA family protein [Candidatus Thorarchaeota archaeon]|jgi:predicted dehydrogenase
MIRLAMLGTSPGNGHPYSWSAIINGYEPQRMIGSPYPNIYSYLSKIDIDRERISDARVTHIWSSNSRDAEDIAKTCFIQNIVTDYLDVIGQVDGVILPYDDGSTHFEMARPFLYEGLPVLIDKPLADNVEDAYAFRQLVGSKPLLMSCSALRFSDEIAGLKEKINEIGFPIVSYGVSRRKWLTYGVHLLEIVFTLFGRGLSTVRNVGTSGRDNVILTYPDGKQVLLMVHEDLGPILHFGICGTQGMLSVSPSDWFQMFRATLQSFINMIETGKHAIDLDETVEIVRVLVGAELSRNEGQRVVNLEEL